MTDRLLCSFCGNADTEVDALIAGPGVYICDRCVELSAEIVKECKEREIIRKLRVGIFNEFWEGA